MGNCKEPSGGNEKADSCLIRVNSISHLSDFFGIAARFSACCACRPQTRVCRLPNILAAPAPEMRLACQPQWCFSTIANNQKIRIELARIRISLVLAYFWSTSQVKLYPIYWRELLESKFKPVRPLGFQRDEIPLAQVWARGAPNVPPSPISVLHPSHKQISVYKKLNLHYNIECKSISEGR